MKTVLIAVALLATTAVVNAAVPDGYIVRVENTTVYLDWGKASGVQIGDRFEIYRKGAVLKHPVTGEVLGQTDEKLGSGTVQSLDDKFSRGRLEGTVSGLRSGDQTRWAASALTVPTLSTTAVPDTSLTPAVVSVTEIWRSEPLEKDAAGITFADLDGDGKKDVIVAYRRKIVAYRFKDKKLEVLATFDNRKYRKWLAVDTADVKQDGHPEVFATVFLEGINRPQVIVLRFENGAFTQTGSLEGFARSFQRSDGSRHLYWQNVSRSHDLNVTAVSELRWEKNTYQPGPPLDFKLSNDQLFGFAWGDWFKNGKENAALLERGERLRLVSPDVKWRSSEVFGGTKNDFSLNEDTLGAVYPRLWTVKSAQGDRDQLLVPANRSDLGVRFTHLKLFKKAELVALSWSGPEMKPVWRLAIRGYLPDFGIADILPDSKPQLWIAAVAPDDKTFLVAYTLP